MPKVSIILPVYNGEQYLKQAINSVLVQSFSNWELIVIDDGSADRSLEIIDWYQKQDSRVRLISHEQNLGLVASLNEGAVASTGEFLARLDCDDFWPEPRKLEKQTAFLEGNPSCALVGTWAVIINQAGMKLKNFAPPAADKQIRGQLLLHNCFLHSSIMVRKSAVAKAGFYRAEEPHVEDYGLWLRIGEFAKLANLPEIMVTYRVMPGGVTKTKNREQIVRALDLIKKYKHSYRNYFFARLKWRLQYFLAK